MPFTVFNKNCCKVGKNYIASVAAENPCEDYCKLFHSFPMAQIRHQFEHRTCDIYFFVCIIFWRIAFLSPWRTLAHAFLCLLRGRVRIYIPTLITFLLFHFVPAAYTCCERRCINHHHPRNRQTHSRHTQLYTDIWKAFFIVFIMKMGFHCRAHIQHASHIVYIAVVQSAISNAFSPPQWNVIIWVCVVPSLVRPIQVTGRW